MLTDTWSQRSTGYVAPWPDRGALEACFAPGEPISMLERLLSTCRLLFQGRCEGEEMVLLSCQLGQAEIEETVRSRSVQRALRDLSAKAVFAEPVATRVVMDGIPMTVHAKPRPSGGHRKRRSQASSQAANR